MLFQEELIAWAVTGDIILAVVGAFSIIFGYGVLRMKK
jgi:hypothetical protein